MSDLIERQKAIDAISCDITVTGRQNAELVAATIGTFADRIKALPPAQPEIIHCRECVYGEQDYDGWWYCRSFGCQVGDEDGSGFCADAERKK